MSDSWTKVNISQLLEVSIGGVWGGDPGTDEIDVRVYRQTEFDDNGTLSMPSDAVRSITKNQLKSRTLHPGDVLMQKSAGTPTLPGRVVIVPSEIERNATCSNFLHLLRADTTRCNSHFLFWLLWFNHQSGKAFEFQRGTNIKNLDLNQYLAQPVLLPPLAEQKRIVNVVSSVDSYIDALLQQADTARTARNAVLHELLSAGGEGWTKTTIGEVASINPKESALAMDAPFVPMDAVKVGKRFVDYFEPRGERSGARAKSGDVLFARITPCLENGKVAQIQDGVGACGGSTEFIVVRGTETIDSDFIYFWATLESTRDLAAGLMTGTTGRQRLSANDLGEIALNLPPLAEQKRIVEIVSSIDDVIQSTEQAASDAMNLRAGLLSDLLSGEHEIPASYDSLLGAA